MSQRLISTIKKIIIANLLFTIFIAIFSTFLIIRALPENHIDMDSAVTLLTARWWARDGFLKNHFLQLNAGYGKLVKYFEEPELNEHAQGTVAGGLIGHKLYYTHYPSLYIIPVALLIKLGITKLFLLKILSLTASILSLIFLYVFVKLLSNKYIALIGTVYFGISPLFIKWSDSLSYIPQEDMWRFLILMLSILTLYRLKQEISSFHRIKWHIIAIWGAYFLLALTSFNSTFFIFTWLIGLTAIYLYNNPYQHKVRIFIIAWMFWASAPILGFALQLVQNINYLGWHNTLLDIYGAFNSAGNKVELGFVTRFEGIIKPFLSLTGILNIYAVLASLGLTKFKNILFAGRISPLFILPTLAGIGAFVILKLKKFTDYKIPSPYIVVLLAIAPLVQTFILPLTGYRDSMGRLTAPFVGIILGMIVWMLFLVFRKNSLTFFNKFLFLFVSISLVSLFIMQFVLSNEPRLWPAYAPISDNGIAFAKAMKKVAIGEKAVFMINKDDTLIPEEELKKRFALYDPTHYQANYIVWEYYFDMPLLNFINTSYLVRDMLFLEKRSEFPFTAVVTSDNSDLINELYKKLRFKHLSLSPIEISGNRYFFVAEKNKN